MKERFEGKSGHRVLVDALLGHTLVEGNVALAEAIADEATIREVERGTALIVQGGGDNHVFLILSGLFMVVLNGRNWRHRGPRDHVGEMAAIEPSQSRSATVIAQEQSVVAQLTQEQFRRFGDRHPQVWRAVAKELSRRLNQRNAQIAAVRETPAIFIASSSESLPIARALRTSFAADPFTVTLWTDDDVFTPSSYSLESLEEALDRSDFGIVIAAGDDTVISRQQRRPVPRDNVTFELGLFIGRLGRKRTLLLEPRTSRVKLASDLFGLTTVRYDWDPNADPVAQLATTSDTLRKIFLDLGPL